MTMNQIARWLGTGLILVGTFGCGAANQGNAAPAASESAPPDAAQEADEPTAAGEAPSPSGKKSWAVAAAERLQIDKGEFGGLRGCTGSITEPTQAFFLEVYRASEECFAGRETEASITFHSTVEKGGGISEFSVYQDDTHDEALTTCLQNTAFSIQFPEADPEMPCVQVIVPFRFP